MSIEKRVALYTRVSTIEQAEEGYSIAEQERLLTKYCEKHGYTIYKCYSDRGISGKSISARPALKEMLKDAEEKKFDLVLVWKINRLARNILDLLKMVDVLEKKGIAFRSYSESFETETPNGKLQLHMMAAVGEFERGTIAQNVKMGMLARATEGRWCGGQVLGYNLVQDEDSKNKKRKDTFLTINEKEAETVKLIFNMYANGNGYKAIVNKINREEHKTKKGNPFSVSGVKEILNNPVYIGKIRYNVRQNWNEKRRRNINPNPIIVDGVHESIIDIELWDKVQTQLSLSKGKPTRMYDGEYPLTGILKCPVCGAGMVIMRTTNTLKDGTKRRIAYYACGAWKNKGTAVCNSNTIRVDKANNYVFGKLGKLLSSEKIIKEVVEKINRDRCNSVNPSKKELDKELKELKKLEDKKKKLFDLYEEDIISKEDFTERLNNLKYTLKALEEKCQSLKTIVEEDGLQPVSYELIKNIMKSFKILMENVATREQKKKLVHLLISEITLNEKREIDKINLNINNKLIEYLNVNEEVSKTGTSSSFYTRIDIKIAI